MVPLLVSYAESLKLRRALELAEKEDLDCGVLDVRLKDGLVFPAADVLRRKGVNIVFYSGEAEPNDLRSHWRGAKVLSKPLPLRILVRVVAEASGHPMPLGWLG
ncbi:MAG: hypothetical protein ACLPJY_13415 [Rhodomicrobium sp.]